MKSVLFGSNQLWIEMSTAHSSLLCAHEVVLLKVIVVLYILILLMENSLSFECSLLGFEHFLINVLLIFNFVPKAWHLKHGTWCYLIVAHKWFRPLICCFPVSRRFILLKLSHFICSGPTGGGLNKELRTSRSSFECVVVFRHCFQLVLHFLKFILQFSYLLVVFD